MTAPTSWCWISRETDLLQDRASRHGLRGSVIRALQRHLRPFPVGFFSLSMSEIGREVDQRKPMTRQRLPGFILAEATLRAADQLGLSRRQLAAIVGVSEPTISRWKRGDSLPDEGTKPFELAALFMRAFRSLDAITGGDERVARAWLTSPNLALASRPIDQMTTVRGLVDVATYLDARRAPAG